MSWKTFPLLLALVIVCLVAAHGAILPEDVLVVCNASSAPSVAVANYYCAARIIPSGNKCPLPDTLLDECINLTQFKLGIYNPIRDYLVEHFAADPADPSACSIKCIVLCYGVPTRVYGSERYGSVDSALTMLFEHAPWGRIAMPISYIGASGVVLNPYQDSGDPVLGDQHYLSARGNKPADFATFRASSYNDLVQAAPSFGVVRVSDGTHAIAGGDDGMLYRGALSSGSWSWTPTIDEDKDLVAHTITDISVVDSDNIWACTAGGSVLKTTNGGSSWSNTRSSPTTSISYRPAPSNWLTQVSFYDASHGWSAGYGFNGTTGPIVLKTDDGGDTWTSCSGTLPSGMTAVRGVAACDAEHVWIAGNTGVYFSSNGGTTWTQQSSVATIRKMRVLKVGSQYLGWAVGSDGTILHTTDGSSWHEDTNPVGTTDLTDLAVFDSTHATIAYGSGSFLRYYPNSGDGYWEEDTSDSGSLNTSVAPDGSGNCLAASNKTLRYGQGDPFTWAESYSIPDAHWHMRYLVTRLDGFSEDTNEDGMPDDVKNMIDRGANPAVSGTRNFVLDGTISGESWIVDGAANLAAVIGTGDTVFTDYGSTYLTGKSNVMGYFSHGRLYDSQADLCTTWGRPFNTWRNGGVGMFETSFDKGEIRRPSYVTAPVRDDNPEHLVPHTLTVTGLPGGTQYNGHWLELFDPSGTLLARSNFSNGTATIDLSAVTWPTSGNPYAEIHFPDDDPDFPGQPVVGSSTKYLQYPIVAADQQAGATYSVSAGHPRSAELIREGASGALGHTDEPGPGSQAHQFIFPRYAMGYTWAEAAYLGMTKLGAENTVLGDPLMAPYAAETTPTVAVTAPTNGATLYGIGVPIAATAQSSPPNLGIARVDFWLKKGTELASLLHSATQTPYSFDFDTMTVADGTYTLRVVAYQNPYGVQYSSDSITITVANAGHGVTITEPEEGAQLTGTASLAVSLESATGVQSVEYYLQSGQTSTLAATGTASPTFPATFDTSTYIDGPYTLKAFSHWTDGTSNWVTPSPTKQVYVVPHLCSTIGAAKALADDTTVFLAAKTAVTGTQSPIVEGGFYIEETDRSTGIGIDYAQNNVPAWKLVDIRGTVGTDSGTGEKFITASQVWVGATASAIAPVGVNVRDLGNSGVDAVAGYSGVGLCNLGQLVRTWGRVNYYDSNDDVAYIDDGSMVSDGDGLSYYTVPLDGGPQEAHDLRGVKVALQANTFDPWPGEYVFVTGIASRRLNGNGDRVPLLRAIGAAVDVGDYHQCFIWQDGDEYHFSSGVGDKVIVTPAGVISGNGNGEFWAECRVGNPPPGGQTLVWVRFIGDPDTDEMLDAVYIKGAVLVASTSVGGLAVEPDMIYSAASEQQRSSQQMRGSSAASLAAPPTTDVRSKSWFIEAYNTPGAIGWALSQPEGTVMDLLAEDIVHVSENGLLLGLKESFEPMDDAPNLVLVLGQEIAALSQSMPTIDIIGGTMTTLSDGRRAVVNPTELWAFTNSIGRFSWGVPSVKGTDPLTPLWPWKIKVLP